MSNRSIKKVAILGSGVMGSRIACHFANIGVEVLLLDMAPNALLPEEEKKGLTLDHPLVKNRIVKTAFEQTLKANPAPLYIASDASKITLGNFQDDLPKISTCDWITEVVVENLEIKKKMFEQVELYRKPGTLISSNTSGIPIQWMAEGRSDDFKAHFCGTHFFNPPRYLRLLEIIPSTYTLPEVVDFHVHYGARFLGKSTVLCKDTPAFIANRVGIYAIMEILHTVQSLDLTVEEIDKLTGPVLGRPKSATFRTGDVVGLDTLVKVAQHLHSSLPQDEAKDMFVLPDFLAKMMENKWLGDKTGQGFYKKVKSAQGTEILALDLKTLEYKPSVKVKFAALEQVKTIEELPKKLKVLLAAQDKAGVFYRKTLAGLFAYVSHRIPEIADEIYKIDEALKTGFGWELGPFEMWDAIGLQAGIDLIASEGKTVSTWVKDMVASGQTVFYQKKQGKHQYYDQIEKAYKAIPGTESFILLDTLQDKKVWGNAGATLTDLGDGIVNLAFHSKMNTMGGEVIAALQKSIELAEKDFRGLTISNEGANFSVGANLMVLLMYAMEQEWEEIDMMIRTFQKTMLRARYSSVPVVVAPHQMTFGGGCELSLHADALVAHAETYMGLVEFGVGLIPAGGGSKELTLRASDAFEDGDIEYNTLKNNYMSIAMAKVSTSGQEAKALGLLKPSDLVIMDRKRLLAEAKSKAIALSEAGYTQPTPRKNIKVQGRGGLSMFYVGANAMQTGHFISEHDAKISRKLAWIMSGGDLTSPQMVTEQYLLDLEREAFLSLCGEKKTLERIQSMLSTGKALRN